MGYPTRIESPVKLKQADRHAITYINGDGVEQLCYGMRLYYVNHNSKLDATFIQYHTDEEKRKTQAASLMQKIKEGKLYVIDMMHPTELKTTM